jgi:hypothetical protein
MLTQRTGATRSRTTPRVIDHRGVRSHKLPADSLEPTTLPDPTVCPSCNAVYSHKTWRAAAERSKDVPFAGAPRALCPACRRTQRGPFLGRVLIRGNFVPVYEEEICRRVHNVAARAEFTQPEHRLVSLQWNGAALEVITTSQGLAHRIARELKKTFGGRASYNWAERDRSLLATWQRDE